MKHKSKGRQFKRNKSQKKALMKHLSEAIILQEKITTTTAKAKELSSHVEKLITVAKKKNLLAAKDIHGKLSDEASKKLLREIADRYKDRSGGYTRIIKISERKGDIAKMSVIEFV
ncbi:MAG: 50S ribosomal protein L17 [Candidatus Andersenbacteria bacterium]|jgi:large subunit ribosomal protein L17|nr:50S ribosomal protein L17 [Candidatus Andersenbacteria bacterium]